ncbi:elongation factor 1-delta-like [Phalaenopsis equestris]|uniref:elongation factor 1-delta-like n=1 Tax=Phalaenopsis equestris TaxID=78828 RepID=UPI0009E634EE|nr:elongation factor 1-delta-like [Phalaenopsis equestris]
MSSSLPNCGRFCLRPTLVVIATCTSKQLWSPPPLTNSCQHPPSNSNHLTLANSDHRRLGPNTGSPLVNSDNRCMCPTLVTVGQLLLSLSWPFDQLRQTPPLICLVAIALASCNEALSAPPSFPETLACACASSGRSDSACAPLFGKLISYQASKDDIAVHAELYGPPSSDYVNVSRWYNHIEALLRLSGVSGEGQGVKVEGSATVSAEAPASPPIADTKASSAVDDDDDDVDLFGEETEEEKKAAEERAAAVKASGKKKESGKSSVLLDVKPWDDETDMQKLEEAVRNVQMEGLLWGASKLVPVGYGIKKLQIMMTIVDDLVSVDNLIEDYLTSEPANEFIQSCDIVAFNKI